MQAVRLFTTVDDAITQALPELIPLRGRRVEMLVLDETEPTRVPATAPWGFLLGQIRLKEDFDAPLPEEVQQAFEGEGS